MYRGFFLGVIARDTDPAGSVVYGVGLRLGMRVRIPPVDIDVSVMNVVCCQVEVFSATGRSLIQRSPNEFGMSVCDLETLTKMRPRPDWGCCAIKRNHPERDGSHSPPSSTEVKNEWSYTSIPPYAFMTWTVTLHCTFFFVCERIDPFCKKIERL